MCLSPTSTPGSTASSTWASASTGGRAWTGSRRPLEADEHAGLDGQLDGKRTANRVADLGALSE
ncbi:MAG: hypothetical protein H6713_12140 [Myxococcales bacterium]|nr:hypothetical protein [Myxococcales bacterium]